MVFCCPNETVRQSFLNYNHTIEYFEKQQILIESCSKNIYLFKVNNKNTRKRCEVCSNLKIMTPNRRHQNVINGLVLMPLLLTLTIFKKTIIYCFYSRLWTNKCLLETWAIPQIFHPYLGKIKIKLDKANKILSNIFINFWVQSIKSFT